MIGLYYTGRKFLCKRLHSVQLQVACARLVERLLIYTFIVKSMINTLSLSNLLNRCRVLCASAWLFHDKIFVSLLGTFEQSALALHSNSQGLFRSSGVSRLLCRTQVFRQYVHEQSRNLFLPIRNHLFNVCFIRSGLEIV